MVPFLEQYTIGAMVGGGGRDTGLVVGITGKHYWLHDWYGVFR
jgi:hypothetical protein